jgi:DNA-binding transcriptional MerR regulator
MDKSPDAFRTISEVADLLDTPAHVLRFWESRFPQIRPVKRAGGRRYYRPTDVALLAGIRLLLHDQGLTIRGVQKILREQGVRHVCSLVELRDLVADAQAEWAGEDAVDLSVVRVAEPAPEARVIAWPGPRPRDEAQAEPDEGMAAADDEAEAGAAPPDAVPPPAEVSAEPEPLAEAVPEVSAEPPAPAAQDVPPDDAVPGDMPPDAPSEPEEASVAEPDLPAPAVPEEPAAAVAVPPGDSLDDMPLFRFAGASPAPAAPAAPVAAVPSDVDADPASVDALGPTDQPERPMSARIRALPAGRLDPAAMMPLVQGLRDLRLRLDQALATTPPN